MKNAKSLFLTVTVLGILLTATTAEAHPHHYHGGHHSGLYTVLDTIAVVAGITSLFVPRTVVVAPPRPAVVPAPVPVVPVQPSVVVPVEPVAPPPPAPIVVAPIVPPAPPVILPPAPPVRRELSIQRYPFSKRTPSLT